MTDAGPLEQLEVAIISRDNEDTIGRTIESVRNLASRVVVVDSGSTDRTKQIARGLGAEVLEHEWLGHIRQKQYALDQLRSPWALSLDSDESVDAELSAAVRAAVERNNPSVAGYEMNRRTWFGEVELRHTWQPEWRTRLVRRERAKWAGYNPHDRLDVEGPTARLDGLLRHDAYRDVRHFLSKQIAHGLNAAESYYALGRRGTAIQLMVSPPAAVLKQLVLRSGWLDGWRGWVAAFGAGVNATVKHMRLLELTHLDNARPEDFRAS
ncbi:MAG: glycosyltransferase family 2 protein [Phycisphaerales bacterium]